MRDGGLVRERGQVADGVVGCRSGGNEAGKQKACLTRPGRRCRYLGVLKVFQIILDRS